MCGRFTLKRPDRIRWAIDLSDLVPRYNIAPSQEIAAVVQRGPEPEATFLQWGLIPYWSKEPKGVINAREETIEEKASFRDSFERRRCLILADGFYEWERNGKISQPYYFQMKDGAPFAFAGIWDRWQSEERTITSCAIITTKANEVLAPIHNRMPVILDSESYDLWLTGRTPDVKSLLTPYPASAMTSHAVSRDVNGTTIDEEHLVQPVDPTIGVNLRLF